MVWLWKCGLRMNTLSISSTPLKTSSAVMSLAFLLPTRSPKARMPLVSAARRPGFVGAAVGGRDGVAIIAFGAVGIERPGDRPFGAALGLAGGVGREVLLADERLVGDGGAIAELLGEMVGEAVGELEDRAFGDLVAGERGVAAPADLDPGEEVGLRAGELVEALGRESGVGAEDFRVGGEGDGGAALVGGGADLLQLRCGEAAREGLAVELLVARDLDDGVGRKRIDDADADAVEAARGRVSLALELPARVERGHDDFERRLAGIFGVRVDRDAAAVVEHAQAIALLERDLDAGGEAGDRFVHGIVDDFGGEVVKRALVGAADVHAWAAADRLEAFEHLDRASVVAVGRGAGGGREEVGH